MTGPYPTTFTSDALRRTATRLAVVALFVLGAPLSFAEDPIEPLEPQAIEIVPSLEDDLWRQRGLAYIDLPLGIRARFDTAYSRYLYSSDSLAQRYLQDAGPGAQRDRTLESRIALSRPVAPGIELEIAWETRNNLEASDPMGFGRQTVGARIRISP
jgi:hypothetical protein